MSQVKLILRPPPNVDFVHGYPGIPPGGPDRPQAAVKGTVEVRAGPQGAKTKWVRIELRKVETLPGGGGANTFYDFVGPSPINLWQSSDEFGVLRTNDFPFSIRIPESIPPSISLDNRAGIQYELVASLCTKGKRSFFRKRKSVVVSTQASVIIDKHELHSTWPVYCQPETRQTIQNGATLIVDRNQLCYGPGDRISLVALLKSDTLSDTILRGFELTLKEWSRFRPGQLAGRKAAPPQERVVTICDSKLAINGALFPGHEHRAELNCLISQNHTTTSLNSARHIDVTYILSVKAIVDNVPPIVMDLPVVISNWQRSVSQEAIRRIGPTPALSLGPVRPISQSVTRAETARPSPAINTLPISKDHYDHNPPTNMSLPARTGTGAGPTKVDEFGFSTATTKTKTAHSRTESVASSDDHNGGRPAAPLTNSSTTTAPTARRTTHTTGPGRRLTVTNPLPEATQSETDIQSRPAPTMNTNTASTSVNRAWMTAGEEKQRLYDIAKAKVERIQNSASSLRTDTPPPQQTSSPQIPLSQSPQPTSSSKKWPTAEEEKTRLYNKAQAAVLKKQRIDSSPPASIHDFDGGRVVDSIQQSPTSESFSKKSTPQEMYSEAIAARNQAIARQQSATTSPLRSTPKTNLPQYPTAEQEKAALKRYREAKEAVDRVQNGGLVAAEDAGSVQLTSGPVAYESLYPEMKGASTSTPAPANDLPPPFETPANLIPASHLSEKERLRRQYEEQDAAALARQKAQQVAANTTPPPLSREPPLLPINGVSSSSIKSAIPEKEAIRRKFEAQAMMNAVPGYTPQPPPRNNSASIPASRLSSRGPRPPPAAPFSPGKVLTAAEEKALLKAHYVIQDSRAEQEQQQLPPPSLEISGGPSRPTYSTALSSPIDPPLPPPLMPRPPAEYIQETQEEDARVAKAAMNHDFSLDDGFEKPTLLKSQNGAAPRMDMRPFSPFSAGFDQAIALPPPLPPKPAGE